MTTAPRRPAARRKAVTPAAAAVDVIDEVLADVTAGGLHWPASDADAAPDGYGWAREFAATPFVSTLKIEPVIPEYICPSCQQVYLCSDTVCDEVGDHPATKVVARA
jgi:hypothetical protein